MAQSGIRCEVSYLLVNCLWNWTIILQRSSRLSDRIAFARNIELGITTNVHSGLSMRRIQCEGVIQNVKRITCLTHVLKISNMIVAIVGKLGIVQNRVLRQLHHHKGAAFGPSRSTECATRAKKAKSRTTPASRNCGPTRIPASRSTRQTARTRSAPPWSPAGTRPFYPSPTPNEVTNTRRFLECCSAEAPWERCGRRGEEAPRCGCLCTGRTGVSSTHHTYWLFLTLQKSDLLLTRTSMSSIRKCVVRRLKMAKLRSKLT